MLLLSVGDEHYYIPPFLKLRLATGQCIVKIKNARFACLPFHKCKRRFGGYKRCDLPLVFVELDHDFIGYHSDTLGAFTDLSYHLPGKGREPLRRDV